MRVLDMCTIAFVRRAPQNIHFRTPDLLVRFKSKNPAAVNFRDFRSNPRRVLGCRNFFTMMATRTSLNTNTKSLVMGHPEFLAKHCAEDIHLNFTLNPEDIMKLSDYIISHSQATLDSIGATNPGNCSIETVIKRLGSLEGWIELYSASCTFPLHVALSQEVRSAAAIATEKLNKLRIESSMRQDIYNAVRHAKINFFELKREKKEQANVEDVRLMDKIIEDFFQRGAHLKPKERDQLSETLVNISSLSTQYAKNISEDETRLLFTRDELVGLPDTFIDSLKKEDDKYIITMQYPHVHPILGAASNSETRRKTETSFNSRCRQNVSLLEKTLLLRQKASLLLEFSSHAEFKLAAKMAKTPEAVKSFLLDLKQRLAPLAKRELATLLEYKKKEVPEAFSVDSWDINYYKEQWLKDEYKVDQREIQQYFPIDHVFDKTFKLFGEIFGIRFSRRASSEYCWFQDVELVRVEDILTNKALGYFYMDLFPRDGKFTHAACFPLQPGVVGQQLPVAAMVANFTPQKLLMHSEVETFFHELGHVLHFILSSHRWARFGGLNVEHDFVETPSQLLENWCWDKGTLESISSHVDSKISIPQATIDSLIGSRRVGAGLFYLRQVAMATFDMELHSASNKEEVPKDTTQIMHNVQKEILGIPSTPGTCRAATFAHLMGGYDAGYYGYLWSLVFAADIFHSKFVTGPLKTVGMAYRTLILESGAAKDGKDMLSSFLGREPKSDSFLKMLTSETSPNGKMN